MEENNEDFHDMLNTMKIQEFREAKQQKLISIIFRKLRAGLEEKAEKFYRKTVYAKVFNAIMLAYINYIDRLSTFSQHLENFYFKLQLKTHFDAMKEFKILRQQEANQKVKTIQKQIKKNRAKTFCNIMRLIIKKKEQQILKKQISRTPIKQAYITDTLFDKQKRESSLHNDFRQVSAKQNYFKKSLENSRKSQKSSFSVNSEFGTKRKFAAVKQLPKLPQLQEIQERTTQIAEKLFQKQVVKKDQAEKFVKMDKQISSPQCIQLQTKQISKKTEQSLQKQKLLVPQRLVKKYNKDSILAVLSQLKMLEIYELNSIVNEYSNTLKYQALINQKGYIAQSIATLQKIIQT